MPSYLNNKKVECLIHKKTENKLKLGYLRPNMPLFLLSVVHGEVFNHYIALMFSCWTDITNRSMRLYHSDSILIAQDLDLFYTVRSISRVCPGSCTWTHFWGMYFLPLCNLQSFSAMCMQIWGHHSTRTP